MTVLFVDVMDGLAALARGVIFTLAASLVLLGSVFVLYTSLSVTGALIGTTWVRSALAILVFVLVLAGPSYVLAIREPSARDDGEAGSRGTGDRRSDRGTDGDSTEDHATGDRRAEVDSTGDRDAADGGAATVDDSIDDPHQGDDGSPRSPGG